MPTHTLTLSPREQYLVTIVEVCAPRSKYDECTHRVRLSNSGAILRVNPSLLSPA